MSGLGRGLLMGSMADQKLLTPKMTRKLSSGFWLPISFNLVCSSEVDSMISIYLCSPQLEPLSSFNDCEAFDGQTAVHEEDDPGEDGQDPARGEEHVVACGEVDDFHVEEDE